MKKSHLAAIVLVLVAMASMFSLLANSATDANFAEARASQDEVKVSGTLVKSKPMEYDPIRDPNKFSFYMLDKNGTENKVILLDTKPQDFERTQEIVAIGSFQENDFVAKKILMKCPSKYNDGRGEWTASDDMASK
ncbi:MAG TPA: cytochrome c maturation protein CcmE [Bacteroidia bacterium]|nr:cytochrome c maturation protein CcmE [Bacteroidia bacterium]